MVSSLPLWRYFSVAAVLFLPGRLYHLTERTVRPPSSGRHQAGKELTFNIQSNLRVDTRDSKST